MTSDMPIIIAGGGIGGLSAALALAHRNIPVLLLERSKMVTDVGAGVQISPNATASLKAWNVWAKLEKQAVIPPKICIRSGVSGNTLSELSTKDISDAFGAPYMVVHRADLQQALYDQAATMDLIEMHDQMDVREISDDGKIVEVRCATAYGDQTFFQGKALIAADGVWSKIRTEHIGNSPAAYSGKTAWRATLPMQMVPEQMDAANVGLWLSPKAHLVHYPIVGGHMMNIVAIVDEPWKEEGWNAPGDAVWLNQRFARWPREVRDLLAEREDWLKWALCGHDPSQPWTKGRVALLGDSAHAMLPFMAQGAVMAIEDAAILARALSEYESSIEDQLLAYEFARKDRASKVVARAKRNGEIYHMSGLMASARNLTMRMMPNSQLLKQFEWIYSWTPEDVSFS